jgi:hypothetical protein
MPSRSSPTYTASSVSGLRVQSRPPNSLGPSPCMLRTAVPTCRRRRRSAGPDRKGRCCCSPPRFRSANWNPGGFGASPAPSPWCAQERSPPIFRLGRGRNACFYIPEAEGTNPAPPTTCSRDARRTCQHGTPSHNSGPSACEFKSRSPDQPSLI